MNDAHVYACRCNSLRNPLAIDTLPKFSWKIASQQKGGKQISYRIRVASKQDKLLGSKPDIWDSGQIYSDNNQRIAYAGNPLKARTKYYWNVTIQRNDNQSITSPVNSFETAKYNEPWSARWISDPKVHLDRSDAPAIFLRKAINFTQAVKEARLYICGLGLYEAFLEGQRISDHLLSPVYTKYDSISLYDTYDITDLLSGKKHVALGVVLGNGWYNCFTKDAWNSPQASWRAIPKLICEMHVTYQDGSHECIISDSSWQSTTEGPISFNAMRSGEWYDARKEMPHWNEYDFDSTGWNSAIRVRGSGGLLRASEQLPIRIVEELYPVQQLKTTDGHLIFDFGQNFAGKTRVTFQGKEGSHYVIKYAEELTPDHDHVDHSHLSCFVREGEFQTEHYIKSTDESEEWTSHFTYHGFRYAEVSCEDACVDDCPMIGLVMHTDYDQIGQFHCSDEGLNTIQNMTLWSTRSNSMGLPTSDPHREKNAWTGDAGQAFEQMLLNFDSFNLLTLWLDNICANQRPDGSIPCFVPSSGWGYNWGNGPDWSLVFTRLPWYLFRQTGDKSILEKYFPYITRHFSFLQSMAVDHILDFGIGDWCAPFDGPALSVNMSSFKTPVELTDTLCYYETAQILSNICTSMGKEDPYGEIAVKIREKILLTFVDENVNVAGNCQTADAAIIYNNVLESSQENTLVAHLVERLKVSGYHLDFGVLGARYVMDSLGQHQEIETLYRMLANEDYPSYLYLAKNGCTTLVECWNLGGSHNHLMFSHVSAILYRYIAGLRQAKNDIGWKHMEIAPSFLCRSLKCSFDSPNGMVEIQWEINEGRVDLALTIPFGTEAKLLVPNFIDVEEREIYLESGNYEFHWESRQDIVLLDF